MTIAGRENDCIIPNCSRKRKARGLCGTCYQYSARKVKNGVLTWEQIEQAELALPAKHRGTLSAITRKALFDLYIEQYKTLDQSSNFLGSSENEVLIQTAIDTALEDYRLKEREKVQHARVSVGQPLPAVRESTTGPFLAAEGDLDSRESIETVQETAASPLPVVEGDPDPRGSVEPLQEPQEKILMTSRSPNSKSDSERSSERPVDAEEIPAKSYPNRYLPDHPVTTEGDEVGLDEVSFGSTIIPYCLDCNGEGCGRCETQVDPIELNELPEEEETEPSEPLIPMTTQEREKNSQERAEMKARRDARKPLDPDDLAEANGLEPYPRLLRQ